MFNSTHVDVCGAGGILGGRAFGRAFFLLGRRAFGRAGGQYIKRYAYGERCLLLLTRCYVVPRLTLHSRPYLYNRIFKPMVYRI